MKFGGKQIHKIDSKNGNFKYGGKFYNFKIISKSGLVKQVVSRSQFLGMVGSLLLNRLGLIFTIDDVEVVFYNLF